MRKVLLLGWLFLGGLILAGASCESDDADKNNNGNNNENNNGNNNGNNNENNNGNNTSVANQNTPAEQVRLCKADATWTVRYFSCAQDVPENIWYGSTEAQQKDFINEYSASCEQAAKAKEIADDLTEQIECRRIDVSSYEAYVGAVDAAAAQGCEAVIKATEENEFFCLDS
jgi:hypothetical protein